MERWLIYVTWIQIVSQSMWNQKTSVQILLEIIKKGFDTYNYEVKRPLPISKNEKKIDLMKDELGGEIMKEL